MSAAVELTIDGRTVSVPAGTTIFEAARGIGIQIPTVCHLPPQEPAGVCRVCVVEVEKERVMAAACARPVAPGMVVVTASEKIAAARKTLYELLLADHPSPCARQRETGDCELEMRGKEFGARPGRFPAAEKRPPIPEWASRDDSHPNIAVDHAACIVCDRCVRACTDIAHNNVIGRAGKGNATVITFDAGRTMGTSSCVSCGECMVSCPTGALTNRGFGEITIPGAPVSADLLAAVPGPDGRRPLFDGIAPRFLAKVLGPIGKQEGAVVERKIRAGELICREGDFGSTAFYVKQGRVEIAITTPLKGVRNERGPLGRLALKMRSILASEPPAAPGYDPSAVIPIDAPVDLSRAEPVATLNPGDLFGEMTCLNFYPRSATARALEDTVIIEMLRPVLQILHRSKAFRAHHDGVYRARALESHLRKVPWLAAAGEELIDYLRQRVELVSLSPGDVVFRQGDPGDAMYLVRLGFVKVSQRFAGGDLVLAYHGRGEFFGEMGLIGDERRTATCTAADHVELVRIRADDVRALMGRYPFISQALMAEVERRHERDRFRQAHAVNAELDEFMSQGLMEAQSLLLLDLDRCTRCDLCVQACATAHDGVTRLVREGLRYDHYLVATSCRQCRDPLCMMGCPVGSIRRRESLEIRIEDWCIGCGVCADNCPYGNINMHAFEVDVPDPDRPKRTRAAAREKATACDLCKNLGEDQEPSCVVACPHGAAMRVSNPREFFAAQIDVLAKPR